jgi:hypothetical protein
MAGWGVGDCGGGLFRSFFGDYSVYIVRLVKGFLIVVALQHTAQWALKLKKIKSVKRNKIRVIGRVLMLIAALAQLYLLYVLDLNTSQGSLVTFWIAALASGSAESLINSMEVRGDVRKIVVLLLFLFST